MNIYYVEGFAGALTASSPEEAITQAKRYASLILSFAKKSDVTWPGLQEVRTDAAKLLARKSRPLVTLYVYKEE